MNREAWQAAVHRVAQSRTQLNRLSSSINTYIWNLEKWYLRIYLQGSSGETDIENRLMDMGRGEERVRCMKTNMETYITICKIDIPQEFAVRLRKLKEGLCINLEGWDGGRRWEGVSNGRGYMYTYG